MNTWTVEKIQEFFAKLNNQYGLSVNPEIEIGEKNKFPLQWRNGKLLFIPDFFNDDELEDDVRTNLLLIMYSAFYRAKHNDNHIGMHPMFMVKGICNETGIRFLSDSEIETNLRKVRRRLYEDTEYSCFFQIGNKLRENLYTSYKVINIEKTENDILVIVEMIGSILCDPKKVFTEEELYNRTCSYDSIDDVAVDMRKNLIVISGPSGVGKTTIIKEVMKQCPELNKTISVTTRQKRSNEIHGKDYYFISRDDLYDYVLGGDFLEYTLYNNEYYGTLLSEIDKYTTDKPLILVIDVSGRRCVLRHFPLSTSIFIQAPSIEELTTRIESRGENTEDDISERIEIAIDEMDEAKYYDYVVLNDNKDECISEIIKIIKNL